MKLKATLKKLGAVIYKNRSNIEFVGGFILETAGTAVIISKATKSAEIHNEIECMIEDEAPKMDILKYAAVNYTKCYGLGVGLFVAGKTMDICSKVTDMNEISNAYALAASTAAVLSQYRARVIADQGEAKDQEYMFGPQETTVEVKADGTVVQTTKPIADKNGAINLPPHCAIFDNANSPSLYEDDPIANWNLLVGHLRFLDERLEKEEFLWENDIRRDLGLPLVKSGWTSGKFAWKIDPITGEKVRDHLDIGLNAQNPSAQRFRDHLEPTILLQFNVEDNIMDKINLELI